MTLEHLAKALDMVSKSLAQPRKEQPVTTTAQHTPGPWKQEGFHIWSPSAKANIATVSDPYEGQYVEFNPVEIGSQHSHEAYANARLIAAAPALLGAAKAATAILNIPDDGRFHATEEALLILRAAIAQAEGRVQPASSPP